MLTELAPVKVLVQLLDPYWLNSTQAIQLADHSRDPSLDLLSLFHDLILNAI